MPYGATGAESRPRGALPRWTLGWGFEPQITRLGGGCPFRARLPEHLRRGPEPPLILRRADSPNEDVRGPSHQGGWWLRVLPGPSRRREVLLPPDASRRGSPWSPSPASSVSSLRLRRPALLSWPRRGAPSLFPSPSSPLLSLFFLFFLPNGSPFGSRAPRDS